jgi:hypothetical protein
MSLLMFSTLTLKHNWGKLCKSGYIPGFTQFCHHESAAICNLAVAKSG